MALRFQETTKLLISADSLTDPKECRFSDEFQDTDLISLTEVITRQESFPIGTNSIPLNNIAAGKFIAVKPKGGDVQLQLNGANPLTLKKDKLARLWVEFTQVDLIVTGTANEVTIVIAG